MKMKKFTYNLYKDNMQQFAENDYKAFLIALISFEKSLSYEKSEAIYNKFMNSKIYNSIFEINQMLESEEE